MAGGTRTAAGLFHAESLSIRILGMGIGHNRHSIRLRGYDYSRPGWYFVTTRVHNLTGCALWNGSADVVWAGPGPAHTTSAEGHAHTGYLNQYGVIVEHAWHNLTAHIDGIALDEFIIMPDHVHCIVRIVDGGGVRLSEIVRQFKSYSGWRINTLRSSSGIPVWQRNYYEHIIRDEQSLCRIRKYIRNNPRHFFRIIK